MKIAYVIGGMFQGGAETLVFELCMNMAKEHTVLLWVLSEGNNTTLENVRFSQLEAKSIDVKIIGKRNKKDRIVSIRRLRKLIKLEQPDIIHAHLRHIALFTGIAAIGLSKTLIMTAHLANLSKRRPLWLVLKYLIKGFIAVSDDVHRAFIKYWNIDEKNIKTIKNCISVKKYNYPDRIIVDEVKNILAVGRLAEQKNFSVLISAYKIVKDAFAESNIQCPILSIAGQGRLYNDLIKQNLDLGLESYVKFLGIVDNIPRLMKEADIFILPSIEEGYPMVLIEAISAGLPVISTRIDGSTDIIDENKNGILVEVNDVNGLAQAILMLINNKEKRKEFSEYSNLICSKFNFSILLKKHLEFYRKYLNER